MDKLLNGNSKQKIMAAKYMGDNRVTEAIPLLVKAIDSDDSFLYEGKARWTIKCIATVSLDHITEENIGNLCNDAKTKTDEQLNQIENNWKNWYENEYKQQ
jgi:DNA-directed RNA polymerase delta subunit